MNEASNIRSSALNSNNLGITDVHDTPADVCDVHHMRLETVHPSRKEEDRIIDHLDDECQSTGSTENVAAYHFRGAVEGLGLSAQGNRVLAVVGISRSMDEYAMTTERQGRPAAWSQGLPDVCIGDGVGGLGVASSI